MHLDLRPLAAAMFIAAATNSYGQSAVVEENVVVVTATRFAESDPRVPANISVITRGEIERSPARNLPDVLKTLAGVDVRPLYGSMGIDASVDIRGMGETAESNTLILLDGQRLNPVNSGSIKWETVPLSAVQQIEVVRGGGAVLYGDRATGGVINIITDKSDKPRANIRVETGSFGYGSVDVSAAGGKDGWYGSLFASSAHSDGYRRNSDADRYSVSGRSARRFADGELFVDFAAFQQDYGLPSSITRAQFDADPKQASTPYWRNTRDGYRLRPGGSWQLTTDLLLEIDGSFGEDHIHSRNPNPIPAWAYRNKTNIESHSFTPRLRWTHGMAGVASSETVIGFDYHDGDAKSDSLDFDTRARLNRQTASITQQGFYVQNTTALVNGFDATIGARQQQFKEKVADQSAGLSDSLDDSVRAWDLGGGYRFSDSLRAYAKLARNFRLPNTDELFAFGPPPTYDVLFNGTLKPQTGRLKEAGLVWQAADWKERFTLFRQDNENEIGYIAANGRNANLDPLRRQGVESETTWRPTRDLTVRLNLNYLDARFTEGVYQGRMVPLVPKHKESLGVTWDGAGYGIHTFVLQSVGARYFGSDFANSGSKLAGYTTLDYQAAWSLKPWTLALRATNLTNAKYSASGYSGGYYPADPASVFFSARLDF